MIKSIIIVFSIMLSTYCITSNAQVVDQVTFTNIEPRFISSESRSFTVTNPGEVNTLSFSGTISPLDDNAAINSFASDFTFNLIGPESEFELISVQFSAVDSLTETQSFEGSVVFIRTLEEGDTFTFDFFDVFDDGSESANASIDVTFEFSNREIVPFIVPELPDGVDQVVFNDVQINRPSNIESRTFTANNSGTFQGLFFSGRIMSLNISAFPSDFIVNISGPNIPAQDVQFSTTSDNFQSILVEGQLNFSGSITEGDEITFNFIDTFGGGFIETTAVIDMAFVFLEQAVNDFTESNLGNFTLDDGFYDRGFEDGIADNPYAIVNFEVSEDDLYSIVSTFTDETGQPVDGFLYLFDQPFDGNDDSGNIAFNDDSPNAVGSTSISLIEETFLQEGIVYTAVLTTRAGQPDTTNLQGDLRIQNFNGNTASLVEEETELCFPIKSKNDEIVIICF